MGYLLVSWSIYVKSINSAHYGDNMYTSRKYIRLTKDVSTCGQSVVTDLDETVVSIEGYTHHIQSKYTTNLDSCTVTLAYDVMDVNNIIPHVSQASPLTIYHLQSEEGFHIEMVILYPDCPSSEPDSRKDASVFGRRLGVPLQSKDDSWYTMPIFSLELLKYCSIDASRLTNPHTWLGMDYVLDISLLGCVSCQLSN